MKSYTNKVLQRLCWTRAFAGKAVLAVIAAAYHRGGTVQDAYDAVIRSLYGI